MGKRKGSRKVEKAQGMIDKSVECPSCHKKGECYLTGMIGAGGPGFDVSEWSYVCRGCGNGFSIVEGDEDGLEDYLKSQGRGSASHDEENG